MLKAGKSMTLIANTLGVSRATISREVKKGTLNGTYNANHANEITRTFLKEKGRSPQLHKNRELAEFISHCLLNEGLSPTKIIELISSGNTTFPSDIIKSNRTIYTAIEDGYIPNVTKEKLLSNKTGLMFANGHIIIPKHIRESLHLKSGDLFEFEICDNPNKIVVTKIQ